MNLTSCIEKLALVGCLFMMACHHQSESDADPSSNPDAFRILTSFYPVQYFAQRINQDTSGITCPLPPDADPIFWVPNADAIQQFQGADLILINGASFEKWIDKVTLPTRKIVDTAQSFEDRFLRYENAVTHQHGPEGEHSHEGIDGHTWVDPQNALLQAEEIQRAMTARWPEHTERFAQGFAALKSDLHSLDQRLREFADAHTDETFLASHPAYNYLVQRYGLRIVNLDLDPEEMPDNETMKTIDQAAKEHGAKRLLWEGEPLPEIAEAFQALGLTSVLVSPCELAPDEGDYLTVMQDNLDRLTQ